MRLIRDPGRGLGSPAAVWADHAIPHVAAARGHEIDRLGRLTVNRRDREQHETQGSTEGHAGSLSQRVWTGIPEPPRAFGTNLESGIENG
jgi:hypothetical protein